MAKNRGFWQVVKVNVNIWQDAIKIYHYMYNMFSIQDFDKLVMQVKLFNHYIFSLDELSVYIQSYTKTMSMKNGNS